MKKFNPGDEIIAKLPMLGGKEVKGVVIFNDLKGPHPVLAKLFVAGGELCVQADEDGSNTLFPVKKATGLPVVSYLFDDGTATQFKDAATPALHTRTAVGVMKAIKGADGKYSGHEFVSLIDNEDTDTAPSVSDTIVGFKQAALDELPKEVRDVLEGIFGKKR